MSLSRVDRPNTVAAHHILDVGDDLQMRGINALTIPAQVVYDHPFRNRADRPFIGHAMGQPVQMPAKPESTVSSLRVNVPLPSPASVFHRHDFSRKSGNFLGGGKTQGFYDGLIASGECAAVIVFFVVGVLARYAAPVQTVRSMRKSIKLRLRLLGLTAFTKLDRWARLWLSHVCSSSYDEWLWLEPLKRVNVATARAFYHSRNSQIPQNNYECRELSRLFTDCARYYEVTK